MVFAGNGPIEVLAFSFMAFFDPDRTIVFPELTYSFYPVYALLSGLAYDTVPLDSGFLHPAGTDEGSSGRRRICKPKCADRRGTAAVRDTGIYWTATLTPSS